MSKAINFISNIRRKQFEKRAKMQPGQ